MGGVEAFDGSYVLRTELMVAAPIEDVRAWLVDHGRLVDWVPHAEGVPGPVEPGEVRLGVGAHVGATPFVGRTTVETDGDVVRHWVMPGSPDAWAREVRYVTTRVQGGTLLDVEVVTTIPGARARARRAGARTEARGLSDAVAALAGAIEGRRPPRRRPHEAGPL